MSVFSPISYLNRYVPQTHDYLIVDADVQCEDPAFLKFTCSIRVAWKDKNDMKRWINEFSKLTRSDWIQRDMADWKSFKYSGAFSGKFVCQHSSHGKKEDSVRDSNCRSEISFNFVRDPGARKRRKVGDMPPDEQAIRKYETELWRKGIRYLVRINFNHSHNLQSADGLKMLRSKVDDIYYALFTAGIDPFEAYEIFQRMNKDCFQDPINKANASLNPDIEHVQYLHKRYIGAFVPADYESQLKAIENALIDHYESSGVTVIFSKEPLAVAVATPLMQRATQLNTCGDVIFVDSTPAYDTNNHFVTLLLTSTLAGAVPIGCFITRDMSEMSLKEGFKLLKGHLGPHGFAGRANPKYFIVSNESSDMNSALGSLWPNAEIRFNQFQKHQTFWKWLLDPANAIEESDCGSLMQICKQLLNAPTPPEGNRLFAEALDSPLLNRYARFREYIQKEWKTNTTWCLAFRDDDIRCQYMYMMSEASVRSYREVFEHRRQAATLIGLITKIIAECNAHYSEKLMDYALGRNSEHGRQAHAIVYNSKACYSAETDKKVEDPNNSVCLVSGGISENGEEIRYLVNVAAGVCGCSASQTTFYCPHIESAQSYLNSTQPKHGTKYKPSPSAHFASAHPPELNNNDRTLLLQLATGSSCSRSLFAPWNMSNEEMELFHNVGQEVLIDSSGTEYGIIENGAHEEDEDCFNEDYDTKTKIETDGEPSTSAINDSTLMRARVFEANQQKKRCMEHLTQNARPKLIGSGAEWGKGRGSHSSFANETIVDITNRFSRRIYDILQQSLLSETNDGLKTIEVVEEACGKLERLRSVNGIRKFFSTAVHPYPHTPVYVGAPTDQFDSATMPPKAKMAKKLRRLDDIEPTLGDIEEFVVVEELQDNAMTLR
ncbi:hypothetical protein Ddc_14341 [Ditylenchus destructor]|nr:hypothetical protein Ddc_14341 [Ditylenchus destructor]